MDEKNLQSQIDDLNNKLDFIVEEMKHQQSRRREMEDLQDDLTRVGKDLYSSALDELEEVHDYLNTGDMLYLSKKLLRNVRNITRTFEQLESAKDFVDDFAPIFREMILDFMKNLDEFDRKGYFNFTRESIGIMDNIVGSFSVDDVRSLGDNVVTILNTVKKLTQPDILQAVDNAVNIYKNIDFEETGSVSTIGLIKELNKPETKKGMAIAIRFLQNLSEINKPKINNNKE